MSAYAWSVTSTPPKGAESLGSWMVGLVDEICDGELFTITGYRWNDNGSVTVDFVARLDGRLS